MPASSPRARRSASAPADKTELVIITGLSGSGKGTVLKALEDLGYYSVDNLPIELIPKFAELVKNATNIRCAALVVDIREGTALEKFPALFKRIRRQVPTKLLFLEADDAAVIRRFSETRRPHPLGTGQSVAASVRRERETAGSRIRALADHPSSIPPNSTCTSCARPFTRRLAPRPRAFPTSWCTLQVLDIATEFRLIAISSSTFAFCLIPTTSRRSRS